ncbi:MAG: helix-turn-helix domain-containing protein [Clostridia bacterium]|nr:helix-turn-helix domain-containing protein [Clostridia bacterium]
MSNLFNVSSSVNAYKYYLLLKMAEDLPTGKIQEFLSMLLEPSAVEILKDEEIMTTAEAFLNNDLNVSETARALYVHRNTLIYRIEKIKKITGMDIRTFNDALAFKIISVLAKIK